jgi:hypothetical protein
VRRIMAVLPISPEQFLWGASHRMRRFVFIIRREWGAAPVLKERVFEKEEMELAIGISDETLRVASGEMC